MRLIAGRVTGPMMTHLMRRMTPQAVRRGEGQLLVAHPERLGDGYLAVGAANTRHDADVWPAYTRWALHGRAIHPDTPATVWAAEAVDAGVPVTYLWGEHDRFVPVDRGRASAQRIGAGFAEIADAGHLLWLDRPEETARSVLAALDTSAGPM